MRQGHAIAVRLSAERPVHYSDFQQLTPPATRRVPFVRHHKAPFPCGLVSLILVSSLFVLYASVISSFIRIGDRLIIDLGETKWST